jgi:hypothetical protein
MRKRLMLALAALAITAGAASTAHAQATRTWVSGVGDDANPCSRTAPCKTFAGAISKTANFGEISVLDPGGFGAVTITKPISLIANGQEGSILNSGVNGVIINISAVTFPPPSRRVYIEGLNFNGAGTGLNGIRVLAADSVHIRNTTINNNRGTNGFALDVQNSGSAVDVMLDHVVMTGNNGGVNVASVGPVNRVFVNNSTISRNVTFSVKVDGAGARANLNNSIVRGATLDLDIGNGGQVTSLQNNVIGSGVPTDTNALE